MAGKVYFGNSIKQMWIAAPKTGLKSAGNGYSSTSQLLNGRKFVKRSQAASREFPMSWIGQMNDDGVVAGLHTMKDFADGLYGSGNCFWLDPFAMESNLMPPHWAAPMLGEADWPKLTQFGITPTFTTAAYDNSFPMKYANYPLTGSFVGTKKITIIIPSGYTFHFGWHSTSADISAATAAGVRLRYYNRTTGVSTDANPASLLAGGTTRTNYTVDGTGYDKVEIFLANGSSSASTAAVVAMTAQVRPTGVAVPSGAFIGGRGTTGLQFASPVEIEYYTSAINGGQIGLSVTFAEVD